MRGEESGLLTVEVDEPHGLSLDHDGGADVGPHPAQSLVPDPIGVASCVADHNRGLGLDHNPEDLCVQGEGEGVRDMGCVKPIISPVTCNPSDRTIAEHHIARVMGDDLIELREGLVENLLPVQRLGKRRHRVRHRFGERGIGGKLAAVPLEKWDEEPAIVSQRCPIRVCQIVQKEQRGVREGLQLHAADPEDFLCPRRSAFHKALFRKGVRIIGVETQRIARGDAGFR